MKGLDLPKFKVSGLIHRSVGYSRTPVTEGAGEMVVVCCSLEGRALCTPYGAGYRYSPQVHSNGRKQQG